MQTVTAHGAAIPALGFGVFRMSDAEVERVVPAALEAGFPTSTPPRSIRTRPRSAGPFRPQARVVKTCS